MIHCVFIILESAANKYLFTAQFSLALFGLTYWSTGQNLVSSSKHLC